MEKNKTATIRRVDPSHSLGTRVKSFVGRNSRITKSQANALSELWPRFGIPHQQGIICAETLFDRSAPLYIDIGFGTGQALLSLATLQPEKNFIGIETHKPGIGALLLGIKRNAINNVRVFHGDAYDFLQHCIIDYSLDGITIFFPDPWPKRRHHPRRLIQTEFVNLITAKLKIHGTLELATDWDDYRAHMLHTFSMIHHLKHAHTNERSALRPLITKFEARALREGRSVWDLKFMRVS